MGTELPATDEAVTQRINALSREREALYANAAGGEGLSRAQKLRLNAIAVELDQQYDLLHQLQGLRDAGLSPSGAVTRSPQTVEEYEQ